LVAASRKRLSELIRDPKTERSPFWNIFEPTPIRIGPFDDEDLDALLKRTPEIRLSNGARTELLNATNASPLLVLEVLNTLLANGVTGEVSADAMKKGYSLAFAAVRDRIGLVWDDCTRTAQDLFHRIWEAESVSRADVQTTDADTLVDRGFVYAGANKLQRPSRLLGMYLEELPNEGNTIARLFNTVDAYQKNLRGVLESRIRQIDGIDLVLKRFLEHCTEDLPDNPGIFLSHVRNIEDRSFELIWKSEIPNKRVPSEWMVIWKRNEERGIGAWETTFPQGVHRVRLLGLMTGTERSVPCAKHVTKGTYALMNGVHAVGDFGQHQDGATIAAGTAYAALHLCIELAATLNRELPAGQ
jgi:hypothetical protein